jgi:uncharacterized membrane protein HdeD (DUF308 family)
MNRAAVVFGTIFLAVGGAYLLDDLGVWAIQLSYLFPALLIIAGIVLAVTAIGPEQRT